VTRKAVLKTPEAIKALTTQIETGTFDISVRVWKSARTGEFHVSVNSLTLCTP
jgi:hypothetical protein